MPDSQTPTPQMNEDDPTFSAGVGFGSRTPTPQMIFLPSLPSAVDGTDGFRLRDGSLLSDRLSDDSAILPMLQLWHALSGAQKPAQKPADTFTMSETVTGCTHGYGPIGKALGAFIGFCEPETVAAIEGALRDGASQEFDWMTEALENGDSEAVTYHRARWMESCAAADYAQLVGPKS